MTDLELYNQAKEAYYNGSPIMTDFEFDELEERLGLANKAYIGARHNPSYTVKHPYIMGSLSKVQIHKDKGGNIDWETYFNNAHSYFGNGAVIVTPKFDGCSFEVLYDHGTIVSVSTRGDGEQGRDIKMHILKQVEHALGNVTKYKKLNFRGEVLVDKSVFVEKYSEFVNPRSFVAGTLNRDWSDEISSVCEDLSIVIYEIKEETDGKWIEDEWTNYSSSFSASQPNGTIADDSLPSYILRLDELNTADTFEQLYAAFETYRNDVCKYALDGIVIKPTANRRLNNLTAHRPSDCVAIKFTPMLEETEVVDIEWSMKKTDELNPVVIVKPVIMDGKKVTRASGHNWGYLIKNKISVGTKIVLSLAGDIIPFIYKVTDDSAFDESKMCIPTDSETWTDDCHLYKKLTDEERKHKSFVMSAQLLNIPYIGPAAAEEIYAYVVQESEADDFFGTEAKDVPDNILLVNSVDIDRALGGKTGKNAKKAFDEMLTKLSVKDIIISLGFKLCGNRVASEIESYLLGLPYDWSSMASEGYKWALDPNSVEMSKLLMVLNAMNKTLDDFKDVADARVENAADQIPVILTGEPNNWNSKQDFLNNNPQYRMTGSWKEVQIVFTNSLESNTGKMKKAKEKGVKIELY